MSNITNLKVIKRNNREEKLNLDKIHRVITWAAEGLQDVSVSQVEMKSQIQFYNGIRTKDIPETITKAAADLISSNTPDYQYLAARLAIFQLRKIAYGQFTPPSLIKHIKKLVKEHKYDSSILENYSEAEIAELDQCIDHSRDLNFSYTGVKQLESKYLVQNRVTRTVYESPQFLYMLIAMCIFAHYPKNKRLSYIKRFYNAISTFKISLPTPIMAGVRTPSRQFSSCVLIECGDSLDSINATTSAIVKYVSQRAGIGINAGRIRALGSEIRAGEAQHTGCIPFFKLFQAAVKSCSQGGVRGGAATLYFPLWHLEIESLLVLKNNRGVEENRVRHLDYTVQINKLLYQRLIKNQLITLFSPHDVPDLYEAFFSDQKTFLHLYERYEKKPDLRKKSLPASELFSLLMQERASTGRIYIQNVDHCNMHSAFNPELAPVRQSNLCLEITLPTKSLNDIHDQQGEIALCTLSAINLGTIESNADLQEVCELAVRALDALLDYQFYPVAAAKNATIKRRPLGIGVINYAYFLAKHGLKYSDGSANALTHQRFEAFQYYLLKASVQLAKEFGPCEGFKETTYAQGLLPIDTYKTSINEFCQEPLHLDWEELRQDIAHYGLRNSTLSSLMPSETSSQISNATNGIEPPRGLVSIKQSKNGILRQVVPEYTRLKDAYELLWDIPNNHGYLQLVAIMQKFIDQSISANTNYDPSKFPDGKVPMNTLLFDLLTAYKYGLKTLYYQNTRDGANHAQDDVDEVCIDGACKV